MLRSICHSLTARRHVSPSTRLPQLRWTSTTTTKGRNNEAKSKKVEDISPTKPNASLDDSTAPSKPARKRGRPRKPPLTPDLDLDLLVPKKDRHHDLATFLTYARSTSLSPTSTVYIGTHYEYTCIQSLARLGFTLHRVGGASDLGIDLLGTWTTPVSPPSLQVLVQCKAEGPKPSHVRELEGAVVGAPLGWRGQGTVAFLVARGEATRGVREALQRSRARLGFVFVEAGGMVRQVLWNARAGEELEGVGVGMKYGEGMEEVILTMDGRPWKLVG